MLKPEIYSEVIDSILQTEEWCKIEMNDPHINAEEENFLSLLESVKGQIPEKICDDLQNAVWSFANAVATTATLYGMNVANTLHELAANPNIYSQYILDTMAKGSEVA